MKGDTRESLGVEHDPGGPGDGPVRSTAPLPLSAVLREEFELFGLGLQDDLKGDGSGETEADRIKDHFERVHRSEPMNALCLSGGGVRSASFSLGVIQGLAKRGMLSDFHYLSTVSGGGYVGGWLSA